MTSDPSSYHREYSPYGSYSLFQFEGPDVISVLKNSTEHSFVFFKCLFAVSGVRKLHSCHIPNVLAHDLKWVVTRVNKH